VRARWGEDRPGRLGEGRIGSLTWGPRCDDPSTGGRRNTPQCAEIAGCLSTGSTGGWWERSAVRVGYVWLASSGSSRPSAAQRGAPPRSADGVATEAPSGWRPSTPHDGPIPLRNGRAGKGVLPGAAAALRTGSGNPSTGATSWRTRLAHGPRRRAGIAATCGMMRATPIWTAGSPGLTWEVRGSRAAVTPAPGLESSAIVRWFDFPRRGSPRLTTGFS
jgi:hypothetical protein